MVALITADAKAAKSENPKFLVTLWEYPYFGSTFYNTISILMYTMCLEMHLYYIFKQGVALTGRNTTGPPCSVGHTRAQ